VGFRTFHLGLFLLGEESRLAHLVNLMYVLGVFLRKNGCVRVRPDVALFFLGAPTASYSLWGGSYPM
jgi:hypothetical protein